MNKPENYAYYMNKKNNIPYKDWPQEIKNYKNYQRRCRMNPKWATLSDDERRKEHLKVIAQNRKVWQTKWQLMSEDEKALINKKKGSFWNDASDETKKQIREQLTERSNSFWNSMSEAQRKQFGEYRWNLKSDDDREKISKRFQEEGRKHFQSLSDKDIMKQIQRMNDARKEKYESDNEFKNNQLNQLRNACNNYWKTLPEIERLEVYKRRIISAQDKNKFHEKFEKTFNDSYISNDFYYISEQLAVGEVSHIWDYGIYDVNGTLVYLVDLDGAFYHGDNSDYNGTHSTEEYDEKRFQSVPDNVKYHIIYEDKFKQSFEEMIKTLMMNYDQFIIDQFNLCRSIDFPFPKYTYIELMKSYHQLIRLNPDNKYINLSTRNREGDRLISHFHPSIYHAHRNNCLSPYDAWYDDDLLRKVISNRVIYINTLNPNKILQGFNISKIGQKVSVFSAGRAKIIINKYLNDVNEIFDPFSGFSGRMLGCISLNKQYTGQDISEIHVNESKNIIKFLYDNGVKFDASIYQENILQSSGEYESLFTCPPYADKEVWCDVHVDTRSCDDWIDECLNRFKCKKYVFVVDHTTKYKEYIVDEIINKSHIGSNSEYVILIDKGN